MKRNPTYDRVIESKANIGECLSLLLLTDKELTRIASNSKYIGLNNRVEIVRAFISSRIRSILSTEIGDK